MPLDKSSDRRGIVKSGQRDGKLQPGGRGHSQQRRLMLFAAAFESGDHLFDQGGFAVPDLATNETALTGILTLLPQRKTDL
jgi:ribosomal protein L15